MNPKSAIIAVTFRCNSKCLMCDIWRKKTKEDLTLNVLRKLPRNLEEIDITGGEPFLREDLSEIIRILRETSPKARIIIMTNGLLPEKIRAIAPLLLKLNRNLAFRVSLDGIGQTHDLARGIPGAFKKVRQTLKIFQKQGVQDLGVIYTLIKGNQRDLKKILSFCQRANLNFSLNLVHDSTIYYGQGHMRLRPETAQTKHSLTDVSRFFLSKPSLKSWVKAWFYQKLVEYVETNKRPLPCGAGKNSFYLNPSGDIYVCHLRNWKLGNLEKQSFTEIWSGNKRRKYLSFAKSCNSCFLMCTFKDQFRGNKIQFLKGFMRLNSIFR